MMFPQNLKDIQAGLLSGEYTMSALVEYYLANAAASAHLNAYVEVYDEEIKAKAIALDAKIKSQSSQLGRLFGLVVSVKDLICHKDHGLTAASKILDGFVSQFDATAIDAILNEDALIIGRTNCDSFGMGSTNKNSHYGPVLNGIDPEYIAGGSSGGSAVSVQINSCLVALGTDTGGSVRQPSALCGLYGFKPSYGMVSRYGLVAYASSFDQLGLIAHNAQDIDEVMNIVSVTDNYDGTMFTSGLYSDSIKSPSKHKKIAILKPTIDSDGLNPEVRHLFDTKMSDLRSAGHQVDVVDFDYMDVLVPCYYILTMAEASSNLSRYDGVRYGYRSQHSTNLQDMYVNTRTEGFTSEIKKRIMLGSFVLSSTHYDTYFGKAQRVRRVIKNAIDHILSEYDFIALPTTTGPAWRHDKVLDPLEMYLSDVYTVLANLTGLPCISIPLGKTTQGLPLGYQIMTSAKHDADLIHFGDSLSFS